MRGALHNAFRFPRIWCTIDKVRLCYFITEIDVILHINIDIKIDAARKS